MSLTKQDLSAIKQLIDSSIDERVPPLIDQSIDQKVKPMLDSLERRLTQKIDELILDVGQFSLDMTDNFNKLNRRIDNLRIVDSSLA